MEPPTLLLSLCLETNFETPLRQNGSGANHVVNNFILTQSLDTIEKILQANNAHFLSI